MSVQLLLAPSRRNGGGPCLFILLRMPAVDHWVCGEVGLTENASTATVMTHADYDTIIEGIQLIHFI